MTGSLLLVALTLVAPPTLADLAPLEREAPNFHGAIGPAVAARWQADPPRADIGSDITLSLIVTGALNPGEVQRPPLALSGDAFQVINAETPPRLLPGNAVAFDSVIRPRHAGVFEVPALQFAYYRPDRPEGKRFLTTYAEPLAITVSPAEATTPAPPHVRFDIPHPTGLSDRVPRWAWLAPVLVTWPCLIVARRAVAIRMARRVSIDPALVEARRRLADAARAADPPAAVRDAVLAYLTARHGLPPSARTPMEAAAALTAGTLCEADAAAVRRVLSDCDAARFSAGEENAVALRRDALAVIESCGGGP